MRTTAVIVATFIVALGAGCGDGASDGRDSADQNADPRSGVWRARLDSPGGELPFRLVLETSPDGTLTGASIGNGEEVIFVPEVRRDGDAVVLSMPHYDSVIRAEVSSSGTRLDGTWRKRRGVDRFTEMKFSADHGWGERFRAFGQGSPASGFNGRWRVDFSQSDEPAVGVFEIEDGGRARGTFLTTTGDYRYLAGAAVGQQMRLSCFDGAHAFLFHARLNGSTIAGDFWSSDSWHETWTGLRDGAAKLPDAFAQTRWNNGVKLGDLSFPDLEGKLRRLDAPEFAGKARIIYVFGTWCPNCHDATDLLVELSKTYGGRGLSILGLAFEHTGDADRDGEQVRRHTERHGADWPILLAGPSDKKAATEALGALDFVRSYPTTIFLDEEGSVRAIHSGFSGPATGEAYGELRKRFIGLIEELL